MPRRLKAVDERSEEHYAAHGHTAAEVIDQRADATKPYMGLTVFDGTQPHRSEVSVAKNYLTEEELATLNRMVSAFLDLAELRATQHVPMYADCFSHLGRTVGRDSERSPHACIRAPDWGVLPIDRAEGRGDNGTRDPGVPMVPQGKGHTMKLTRGGFAASLALALAAGLLPGLTVSADAASVTTSITVMTYNVLRAPSKGTWTDGSAVAKWVLRSDPDVIGFQENYPLDTGKLQLTSITTNLPAYTFLMNRDPTIAYKTAKYDCLDQDAITLRKPTGYGDADPTRLLVWAKLRDRSTQQVFYVFNTHTAAYNRNPDNYLTRKLQIDTIIEHMRVVDPGLATPFVLTGDFNTPSSESRPTHDATLVDTAAAGIIDSYTVAETNHTTPITASSYSSDKTLNLSNYHYDYVFVPAGTTVTDWTTDTGGLSKTAKAPSDHLPVVAKVQFSSAYTAPAASSRVSFGYLKDVSKLVDITGGSTTTAPAQIWGNNRTDAQKFILGPLDADGYQTIKNVKSGLCLDVKGGAKVSGTPVQQYKCNSTAAQLWKLVPLRGTLGYNAYRIVPKLNPKLSLDVKSGATASGTPLQVYTQNSTLAQQFDLFPTK